MHTCVAKQGHTRVARQGHTHVLLGRGHILHNRTMYIFSMGATVQTECNIRRYCTLLGVILHVAKADIALLMETVYNVQLTINSTVESAIWD